MLNKNQVITATNRTNQMLTRSNKETIFLLDCKLMRPLYLNLFQSNLEFAVQVWSPFLK